MLQIQLLMHITGLPIFCVGDFNLTPREFLESGWTDKLKVELIEPTNTCTTTTLSNSRVIDFGFASLNLKHMILASEAIWTVPYGPHCGLLQTLAGRPREIKGLVLCIPRPLPIDDFKHEWDSLVSDDKHEVLSSSRVQAQTMLSKQKLSTGVAVLGRPSVVLSSDVKFQGELLDQQIINGESLA